MEIATDVAGILVQAEEITQALPEPELAHLPDNAIVCRCERVSLGEIKKFIRENQVSDINQLKLPRVAMGGPAEAKPALIFCPESLCRRALKKKILQRQCSAPPWLWKYP